MKVNGKVKAFSNSAETPHSDDHGREDDHDHEHESDGIQKQYSHHFPTCVQTKLARYIEGLVNHHTLKKTKCEINQWEF